ncbi:MAG: hypothetical protein JOZ07_04020 [Solirubrobacterales bacterium]|nr:hypothetical protein [Solirubrobacterales bacterium]
MHRTRLAGISAATLVAIAVAGGPAAASVGFSGTEHFTFVSTATGNSNRSSAILTGAFVDGGTAILPGKGKATLALRKGKIFAQPSNQSKAKMTVDKTACYATFSQSGKVKLTGGTGAYAGITGHGSFKSVGSLVGPFKNGKCDVNASPVAAQFATSGTLTLG